MLLGLALVVVFLSAYWWWAYVRCAVPPPNFPPGLTSAPLPVVGHIFHVGPDFPSGFQRLRHTHGDAFSFWLGRKRAVALNTHALIEEAGAKTELQGRNHLDSISILRGNDTGDVKKFPGVIFSVERTWQEQRRFGLSALRSLGFGKQVTEDLVREELDEFCGRLADAGGKGVDVRNAFNLAVLNALWRITTGEKLAQDNPKLSRMTELINVSGRNGLSPFQFLCNNYWPLMWVAVKLGLSEAGLSYVELGKLMDATVAPIRATYQSDSVRNFVDAYLRKKESREGSGDSFDGAEGDLNLKNVLTDLFLAGSDSTSTTLAWVMYYLAEYPDVQARVRAELDESVGVGTTPTYADRLRTPYVEAFLHEVQRHASIVAIFPHHTTDAVTVGGYDIPADTVVYYNYQAVNKDPMRFPDPERFDPTRFLTEQGAFRADSWVVPFGMGRRRCLGESLARMELYLFASGIAGRFEVRRDPADAEWAAGEKTRGIVIAPPPFKVIFTPRA